MIDHNTEKSIVIQTNGSSDFGTTMDAVNTKTHKPRRSTRSQTVTEDGGFMMEVTDNTELEQDNNAEGSVSLSRATSVSELTERLTDIETERPAKRARSNRSAPGEELGTSRASSPLSVETEPTNGKTGARKR
jgi:hypothetical protein